MNLIALDPLDRQHLLLSFHAACKAPYTPACLAESNDAGSTWKMVNLNPAWAGGELQTVYFLEGGKTWLWGSSANGLWRTTDGGAQWSQVETNAGGHNSSPVYRAHDSAFYLSLTTEIMRSPDGITWTRVLTDTFLGITGNGTTLYASRGFPWNPGQGPAPYQTIMTSPESDGKQWTQMAGPKLSNGGKVAYDDGHHILYSSNLEAGFWRVVTQ